MEADAPTETRTSVGDSGVGGTSIMALRSDGVSAGPVISDRASAASSSLILKLTGAARSMNRTSPLGFGVPGGVGMTGLAAAVAACAGGFPRFPAFAPRSPGFHAQTEFPFVPAATEPTRPTGGGGLISALFFRWSQSKYSSRSTSLPAFVEELLVRNRLADLRHVV